MNTTDLKIFLVEFGKPDLGSYVSFGQKQDPVFVVAKSFDEASQKAFVYAENRLNNEKSKSILDSDGSLRLDTTEVELQIKSVKIVFNEIIM